MPLFEVSSNKKCETRMVFNFYYAYKQTILVSLEQQINEEKIKDLDNADFALVNK